MIRSNKSLLWKCQSCFALLLVSVSSFAGMFGPDNFEDCVLEKMEGQNEKMISIARGACERQFPYEKILNGYDDSLVTEWYSGTAKLVLTIKENHGEYRVTRYKATFFASSCSKVSFTESRLTVVFMFADEANESSVVAANPEQFKCMRTETVWGRLGH